MGVFENRSVETIRIVYCLKGWSRQKKCGGEDHFEFKRILWYYRPNERKSLVLLVNRNDRFERGLTVES